ncbi:hypothetical protein AVDCRST_MAG94-2083 [uncultured Leptolyngbya sp.]|uniref:Mobile element protein n=1 Tax=uncultured Leptolyngbya sp. TaxID=332963 RepID=A0A6J4LKR4_9CYAN|nr:hypothetical protein AVDCRST_MAG94-2083 [uncultured Leptolyngbya sp.]
MSTSSDLYHRHRFPAVIISQAVWLYFRFYLSYRDVQELLLQRAFRSVTKRFIAGATSLLKLTPIFCSTDAPGQGISGTLMRTRIGIVKLSSR